MRASRMSGFLLMLSWFYISILKERVSDYHCC